MQNYPLITVGVPTYNRAESLRKCLENLLKQTYRNLEIIISDNASTDTEVQKVIKSFAEKDSRIKYFTQKENMGYEGNFNFLLTQSTADYFMWMSDDDYYDGDYIEKCYEFLSDNPEYIICSGGVKYYSNTDEYLFTDEKMYRLTSNFFVNRICNYFSKVGFNGMLHGITIKKYIPENPFRRHVASDWVYMSSMALNGKITYIDTTYYHRRIDGESGSMERIMRIYGLNKITKIFYGQYLAYTVCKKLFSYPAYVKKLSPISRGLFCIIIFHIINYNAVIHVMNKYLKKLTGKK